MSMHHEALTDLERTGLEVAGLPVDAPSQLSDAFRIGMRWQREHFSQAATVPQADTDSGDLPLRCITNAMGRVHKIVGAHTTALKCWEQLLRPTAALRSAR
jgi:hypothetical protein